MNNNRTVCKMEVRAIHRSREKVATTRVNAFRDNLQVSTKTSDSNVSVDASTFQ